ncbi:MAG: HAMP domain-containing histidine kinase [Oscillospiraceae bacterium]|nr:HAMP domain-containing histidine kinase [Oscillospiraceae bacterium]
MSSPLFRRHFLLTAGMILLSFVVLSAAFVSLSYRYIVQEKKSAMGENVTHIAALTQRMLAEGYDPADDALVLLGPMISSLSDSNLLICSPDGAVLAYVSEEGTAPDLTGCAISSAVAEATASAGSYSDMTDLGLYGQLYFVSGVPIYREVDGVTSVAALVFLTAAAGSLIILWKSLATLFFFTAVVVLMIAFVSSSVFAMQQVRPLREISDVVRRFGMGEYELRADDYGRRDEVGDLARSFNTMADSIASSEQRRQEFIANISHELKTPMTTISGFTNGILDGTIPQEKVNDTLQVVASEAARMSRLVRQMLDASALQARDTVQTQVEFDVAETMIQVMISLEGKIRNHQLDMDVHIPDAPVRVWGDPDGITQVCYNLLDNAAKFARPGTAIGVTISTKGSKAYISVKNEGETIPPEELSRIFDRFHKSDRSRSIDKEGVGLGLYIVKTILNNHKENITVTSVDGVTEFVFTLTRAE